MQVQPGHNKKKTEEDYKNIIFNIFSEWRNSTSSSQTQKYFLQLTEQIYKLLKNYPPKYSDGEMGIEISEVMNRIIIEKRDLNIPHDKNSFFNYLYTTLKNEHTGSLRKFNENRKISIPKEKYSKYKDVKKLLEIKVAELGRKLNQTEQQKIISIYFDEAEYLNLEKAINVGSTSFTMNDEEKDSLNFQADPIHGSNTPNDPHEEYQSKIIIENIREAIKTTLNKKQERSRECYKALFTLHCIESVKNLEWLYPVLNKTLLEDCQKNKKIPTQFEIYQKYHPNAKKSSAAAMASKNLEELLKEIKTGLPTEIQDFLKAINF